MRYRCQTPVSLPIDVLSRIDLVRGAEHVNRVAEAWKFLSAAAAYEDKQPLLVFEESSAQTLLTNN